MSKNPGIALGEHFEGFIAKQLKTGRYGSPSEVIRVSPCLSEEREQELEALRKALIAGEQSGTDTLGIDEIRRAARRRGTLWNGVMFHLTATDESGRNMFWLLNGHQRRAVRELLLLFEDDPRFAIDRPLIETSLLEFRE